MENTTTKGRKSLGIITINKDLRIGIDSLNYIIQSCRIVAEGENKGNESWVSEEYYSSLKGALYGLHNYLVRKKITDADMVTLKEVRQIILDVKAFIENELDVEIVKNIDSK